MRRCRLKNDTKNNNETGGSKWLIVVVVLSLDAHCSITVSPSLSLSAALLSAFFYYRMYAKSFNTITPTNKRVM